MQRKIAPVCAHDAPVGQVLRELVGRMQRNRCGSACNQACTQQQARETAHCLERLRQHNSRELLVLALVLRIANYNVLAAIAQVHIQNFGRAIVHADCVLGP